MKRCTLFRGSKVDGYGRQRINGKLVYAHRHAYEKAYGKIPAGMIVRHACDNRACVEPTHLVLGTHKQNAQDRVARGRQKPNHGARNGRATLTARQVRAIRKKYESGKHTQRQLAAEYGVSLGCIFPILKRKTWKHLKSK